MNDDAWTALSPFQTASFAQQFLKKCYRRQDSQHIEAESYRNSYPFLYYLQHGKRHYKLADSAPPELQPLLLFYGMTQLVKACLLTVDADYPKTTAVLAHGVSTRKRKKKNYAFLDDEVRLQKNGLATYFSSELFHLKHSEGGKLSMRELLERIPDLNDLFQDLYQQPPFRPVSGKSREVEIPIEILDDLHMTYSRFIHFLETHMAVRVEQKRESEKSIQLRYENTCLPFPSSVEGELYLPRNREHYDHFPEMLVHFLLLYNLSMIARYETEWWSELFHHAGDDLPFIDNFLTVTKKKIPLLVSRYLRELM